MLLLQLPSVMSLATRPLACLPHHEWYACLTFIPYSRQSRPSWRFSLDNSTFPSTSRTPRSETTPSSTPVYVVVFGYPPYKYSVTVVTSSHSKPPQIQKLTPKSSITSELGTRMRQRQCEQ
ncbi:hypothetical protein EDD16DRAFT_455524 [Pisolithus croceorrhizus]|nr:hypothetical protein EDD16DRAFT_455524 [Pisolithus croceorrhizus]